MHTAASLGDVHQQHSFFVEAQEKVKEERLNACRNKDKRGNALDFGHKEKEESSLNFIDKEKEGNSLNIKNKEKEGFSLNFSDKENEESSVNSYGKENMGNHSKCSIVPSSLRLSRTRPGKWGVRGGWDCGTAGVTTTRDNGAVVGLPLCVGEMRGATIVGPKVLSLHREPV